MTQAQGTNLSLSIFRYWSGSYHGLETLGPMASDSVAWKLWFLPLCVAISSESQTLFKTLFPAISSKQLRDLEG